MNDIAIKVENVSKQYRLGVLGTGTISHDLNRWWHLVRGKEDPYLKVGESNDRATKGESEYVWVLKHLNFEVKKGEVLGIIGKNGAGKSTLLKILSKVTTPTEGKITMKGRVASLLEVGTGFHPELTGKENVYLNGAILGMSKKEIDTKFDEIVDFSGCDRFIDTPVKRYSSGMKVRLAFAVAAFLEPEILIVDEVLAVGDAEFQKKAIGKMQDISSGGGRTVLFVSHNLMVIQQLCAKSILIDKGTISCYGESKMVISEYLMGSYTHSNSYWKLNESNSLSQQLNPFFYLTEFYITTLENELLSSQLTYEDQYIILNLKGIVEEFDSRLCIGFVVRNEDNNVLLSNMHTDLLAEDKITLKKGVNHLQAQIDISYLNEGIYYIDYNCGLWGIKMLNGPEDKRITLSFTKSSVKGDLTYLRNNRSALIVPYLKWKNI
jgi:lipopolysaccharide transport system ATP-binding protein